MQDTPLAALVAARKQLDLIVQSTTLVVLVMGLLFLAMVPFFTGMMHNMPILLGTLIVASIVLGYLFKKRRGYLSEYRRLIQQVEQNHKER
tara:strand:+ start:2005 stop:2277 length:273 start_codon:yes stop_codon:yes gene_type:complete